MAGQHSLREVASAPTFPIRSPYPISGLPDGIGARLAARSSSSAWSRREPAEHSPRGVVTGGEVVCGEIEAGAPLSGRRGDFRGEADATARGRIQGRCGM